MVEVYLLFNAVSLLLSPWTMEMRADDDEAPTDPAARKPIHHDYNESDFEGTVYTILFFSHSQVTSYFFLTSLFSLQAC